MFGIIGAVIIWKVADTVKDVVRSNHEHEVKMMKQNKKQGA